MIMIEIGSGDTGIDHALGHKVDPEIAVHGLDQDLGIVKGTPLKPICDVCCDSY